MRFPLLLLLFLLPHPQDLELVTRDQSGIDHVQVLCRAKVDVGEFRQAAPQLWAQHLETLRTTAARGLEVGENDKDSGRFNGAYILLTCRVIRVIEIKVEIKYRAHK